MAQIVKLRRSSVSGQKPTNSNLQLGELALNTTDGKVFLAKSGSLGPSVEELVTTNATNTGSINLIGNITASGQISGSFIGDGSELYNIPISGVSGLQTQIETITGSIDNLSGSVVFTSQTGSMSVLSASYALTAAFALNALGSTSSEGRTAKLEQTSASTTWTFEHYLGEKYPAISVFDSNDDVIIPTSIHAQDENTLILTFLSPVSGYATATVGGGIPSISSSYDGRVLTVIDGSAQWKEGMISGSQQILDYGFATTGSNAFNGDQTITGSLIISNSTIKQTSASSLSSNTSIVLTPSSPYNSAFIDYVLVNGANLRAGSIMSVWDGTNLEYNETTTNDIGDTTPVTLSIVRASSNITLNAQISSGTWTLKLISRTI